MKVLVPYQTINKQDTTEGARLRKSIKGALELSGVRYSVSVVDDYNVVHLFTPDDITKANDAQSSNIPLVVSALMAESDPNTAFLDFKYKDGVINYTLSAKGEKLLRRADLVLVPNESAKTFLRDAGITSDIKVLLPGINLSRFDFSREDEKDLFYRYYRLDRSKKLVLGTGDYDSLEGINAFLDAAKKCENALFYFFGQSRNPKHLPHSVKSIMKHAPKNVVFTINVNDDIYRSALLNASVFMLPLYRCASVISILDAMAAKCEIIAREQALFPGLLKDGETAHIAKFSETLATLTRDFLDGKSKSTAAQAYEEVKNYSLENIGNKLKHYYQMEINSKKGEE